MSGGGGSGTLGKIGVGKFNLGWMQASNPAKGYLNQSKDQAGLTDPEAPPVEPTPTMEDIAAKEPDKERRRRQRMAMLMAQGRQGTILTGPGGITPNNSIGGGGKQMVGA